MSRYMKGADVLGAGDQYVAVRIKDVGSLVRSQGGRAGGLAYSIAPQTITHKVYDTLKDKLLEGFAQQGVTADVTVETSPSAPAQSTELVKGMVIGAVGVGAGWALWHYALRRLFVKGRR